jgi:autophagy-related protein 101
VVPDVELETLIEQRTTALIRQLGASTETGVRNTGVRGQISVQFFERRRRKAWFTKGEEEVCWEQWTLDVTLATPRTENGKRSGVVPRSAEKANVGLRTTEGAAGYGNHAA